MNLILFLGGIVVWFISYMALFKLSETHADNDDALFVRFTRPLRFLFVAKRGNGFDEQMALLQSLGLIWAISATVIYAISALLPQAWALLASLVCLLLPLLWYSNAIKRAALVLSPEETQIERAAQEERAKHGVILGVIFQLAGCVIGLLPIVVAGILGGFLVFCGVLVSLANFIEWQKDKPITRLALAGYIFFGMELIFISIAGGVFVVTHTQW